LCKTYPTSGVTGDQKLNLSKIRMNCAKHEGYCSFLNCTEEYCKT